MDALYKRLDGTEIRLVTVVSHNTDTAELDLCTYLRDEAPEYDAVSYTWGENLTTTLVSCNGHHLLIRKNLFRALPYIHEIRPAPQRPLWIDAICLNQDDDIEKARHVPLMGVIYKTAPRTLIWLGEAADDSDLAIDSMSALTQRITDVGPDLCYKAYRVDKDLESVGLPNENESVWKSIQALQLRPWYSRLWTLQEIVLANEAIMLCGGKIMPWDNMVMLQVAAAKSRISLLVLPHPRNLLGSLENHVTMMASSYVFRTQHIGTDLNRAILLTKNRKYTEPVDRIWAILALLGTRDQEILVKANIIQYDPAAKSDYYQTFLGIMRLYIEQNLDVAMKLLEARLSQVQNSNLPSWCPDWHLAGMSTPFSSMNAGIVEAGYPETFQSSPPAEILSSKPVHSIMYIDENLLLHIPGHILEIVQTTTTTAGVFSMSYDFDRDTDDIDIGRIAQSSNWLEESLGIARAGRTPAPKPTTNTEQNRHMPSPGSSEDFTDTIIHLLGTIIEYMEQLQNLLGLKHEKLPVERWCLGRKFFRTENGRFGLGPSELEEGDLVCALYAGRPLFVFRPVEKQGESSQRYRIIGDAYVKDLMHGEAFRGKELDDMQVFCLI